MRIAIIGGGLYGITCALKLSKAFQNTTVDLFEKSGDILTAASGSNLYRLHRGYHYPRSKQTSIECRNREPKFRAEYEECVVDQYDHYYCIASERSKTNPTEFLQHCDNLNLEYTKTDLDAINRDNVDLCLEVEENLLDPVTMREILWNRLKTAGINVHLNHEVDSINDLCEYDYRIVTAYAQTNDLLNSYPSLQQEFKYQLVEIPIIEPIERFNGKSMLVLDGPFMGIDPYGRTDRHQLYHVVHSIHDSSIGYNPKFGDFDMDLVNEGLVKNPPETNFDQIIEEGTQWFDNLEEASHIGSKYTIRAVLPDVSDTDARPTIVNQHENILTVFAGKLCSCITAANNVVNKISIP